eukprot:3188673-Amphidinium_carterae.1
MAQARVHKTAFEHKVLEYHPRLWLRAEPFPPKKRKNTTQVALAVCNEDTPEFNATWAALSPALHEHVTVWYAAEDGQPPQDQHRQDEGLVFSISCYCPLDVFRSHQHKGMLQLGMVHKGDRSCVNVFATTRFTSGMWHCCYLDNLSNVDCLVKAFGVNRNAPSQDRGARKDLAAIIAPSMTMSPCNSVKKMP